ncbi:bifunctional UDP-sugar hydrolase/5'-nucleotidase [uncultured Weissella sp.]|uniref:bifunctional metallophosphatase/5'-nucleotidase n=1 Tax=uncultured Weissella sp. TaxID=253243 RepID=UPI0027DD844D|nr:bifunctional UDP-sugar hydrolase/5'-nucleotidase [uncultured Weissella sp.]
MRVTLLSTSDVHGYIRADDFRRPNINDAFGLARAATVIEQLQHSNANEDMVLTIENGDFIQGSPLTNYVARQPFSDSAIYGELAQKIGYDVRILGNHEFNYGRDYLTDLLANDPHLLNANIIDNQTGEPFIGKPYEIFEQSGVRVGVIGLTTSYIPHWETPEHIRNLTFLDPVAVAEKYIAYLRPNVDVIAVAYHGGFSEDLETGEPLEPLTGENQGYQLLQLEGLDALITGHQHREIADVVNQVPTTQPGYRASHVGVIRLELDNQNGIKMGSAELVTTGLQLEQEEIVQMIEPWQKATNEWLDQPVGHVGNNMHIDDHFEARLHNHPFIELVNRVQMDAGHTHIANTALFNDEVQGLPDLVTLRDIMTNYIYPNTLVVEQLTGADIIAALEINAQYFSVQTDGQLGVNQDYLVPKVQHYNYDIWSGIDYTFDFSRPCGNRVQSVSYHGVPIVMDEVYEVAMNNYRASGAGDFPMFSVDKIVREIQRETADLIGDYIMAHPEISISQPTNIQSVGYTK